MAETKIIATIGPASEDLQVMTSLVQAGADIFRLNLSHGSRSWHESTIEKIASLKSNVQIWLDTRGPEMRLGDFSGQVEIAENEVFQLTCQQDNLSLGKEKRIPVSFQNFCRCVRLGDRVAIDEGFLFAKVESVDRDFVTCRALNAWHLSARRHVNLPGERIDLPTVGTQDQADLQHFSENENVDAFALSFLRTAADLEKARKFSGKKLIAKIENFEGVENLQQIAQTADGIMVARGDLGVEMSFEKVPVLQRKILHAANEQGKFSVVATGMLQSMITSPVPARAEISDIATAVWEGADGLMLSGETAIGNFPVQAVTTLKRTIEFARKNQDGIVL